MATYANTRGWNHLCSPMSLPFTYSHHGAPWQALIYTAGLMAEYERFGTATMGYMLLQEMDKQVQQPAHSHA